MKDIRMPDPNTKSRTAKVLFLSFGQCLASAFGFIITVALSRKLSQHDYGTYKQVLLCFTMMMPFLSLGVPMALYYFLPNEKERPRGLIFDNFILLTILGSIYVVFVLCGGARFLSHRMKNPDLLPLLYVMAPYAVIQLMRSAVPAVLMSANKAKVLAVFNAVSRLLECLFIIIAILIYGSLYSAILATLLASILVLLVALALVSCAYNVGPMIPSLTGMKHQLFYGVPVAMAGIFAAVIGYVDQLVVSMKVPPDEYAVYVNGAFKIPLMSILVMSVTAVLLPDLSRMYKNSDKSGMLRIWQSAMVKSSYVMLPATVFLMILANDAIIVAFSDTYKDSIGIFRIFLVLLPFQMVSYGPMFVASNKNKYVVLINVVTLLIHVPLLLFTVSNFGIMGAAVTTVFSQVCIRVFLHIAFIGRILGCPTLGVVPVWKLTRVLLPSIVIALPLGLRFFFEVSPFLALPVGLAYFFPLCYLWLTRRVDASRIPLVESVLRHVGLGEAS